jgi:glycosyltransferase involved in cell wall biosynthesis
MPNSFTPAGPPGPARRTAAGKLSSSMRIFVQLAHGTDASTWRARIADGGVVGINGATPYGYGLAERWGCALRFSESAPESLLRRLVRVVLKRLLRLDLLHALGNRRALLDSEVVWTHTEWETLAVALLRKLAGRGRPRIVGQVIWLFDEWPRLGPLRRAWMRWLLRELDVLTVHSPLNLETARAALPEIRTELVRFGIVTDVAVPARSEPAEDAAAGRPLRLLAVGNDRDRDWPTLIDAVAGDARFLLTIASAKVDAPLPAGATNVRIVRPRRNEALFALYAEAEVSVVPLRPNRHASGATVIQESALLGVPVACSRAGGLEAYFGEDQLRFVPPGDPAALREALAELGRDPAARLELARRARAQLTSQLGAEAFVRRHVELSRELLARR